MKAFSQFSHSADLNQMALITLESKASKLGLRVDLFISREELIEAIKAELAKKENK